MQTHSLMFMFNKQSNKRNIKKEEKHMRMKLDQESTVVIPEQVLLIEAHPAS